MLASPDCDPVVGHGFKRVTYSPAHDGARPQARCEPPPCPPGRQSYAGPLVPASDPGQRGTQHLARPRSDLEGDPGAHERPGGVRRRHAVPARRIALRAPGEGGAGRSRVAQRGQELQGWRGRRRVGGPPRGHGPDPGFAEGCSLQGDRSAAPGEDRPGGPPACPGQPAGSPGPGPLGEGAVRNRAPAPGRGDREPGGGGDRPRPVV